MTDTFETMSNEFSRCIKELHAKRITRYALSVQVDDLTKNIAEESRATLADVETQWAEEGRKSNEGQRLTERDVRLNDRMEYHDMRDNIRGSQRQLAELDATIEGLMLDLSLLRRRMDHAIASLGDVLESSLLYSTEPR